MGLRATPVSHPFVPRSPLGDQEPDATKCKERALLMVFNQNPQASVNTTLRIPLYYSGLDSVASKYARLLVIYGCP